MHFRFTKRRLRVEKKEKIDRKSKIEENTKRKENSLIFILLLALVEIRRKTGIYHFIVVFLFT